MTRAVLVAVAAAAALVGTYLAFGGGGYDVPSPPDPCGRTAASLRGDVLGTAERVGINALNSAACELGVSRERLVLVLTGDVPAPDGLTDDRRNDAFRNGLRKAIEEEQGAGRLGGTEAFILTNLVAVAPVDSLLDRLFGRG